jgi:ATP-binding cassette subfamily C protein
MVHVAKTPLLLQLEAVECGAACLGMILEYYGRVVPLSELRIECGVSRDGVKAGNMVKAARRYGMKAKGLKEGLQGAMELKCPYIAFWNFNHFLVIEGFDKNKQIVYLNDPAHGHRKVTYQEFDDSFTGVVLLMEPDTDFKKGGSKPGFIDALRVRFRHAHSAIWYLVLCGLLLTIPGLLIPAFTQIYIDQVIGEARMDWLRPLVVAMAAAVVFKATVEIVKYICLRRLHIHLSVTMSSRFFWHLLKLPMRFYSQRYSGEIATRQNLNDEIAKVLSGKLADTSLNIMMMVFYAILMFYYNSTLMLIGLAFAAVSFFALRQMGKARIEANIRLKQAFGDVGAISIAALQSIETIKASGQESYFFTKWGARYAKAANRLQELQITSQKITIIPTLMSSLNTMVVYLIGGFAVIDGTMSIGTLVAFTALMKNFQDPIKDLVDLGTEIQEMDGDLKRLDDVLMSDPDPEAVDEKIQHQALPEGWPLQLEGHVELRNVTFGYSPVESPLFDSLTIVIPPRHRVAFVGSSGSGKSTLAYLICGLYQPWQGEILFDGHPRLSVPRAVMTRSFSVVSQEVTIFEGTVRENLTLWDNSIPNETLLRACEDAAILDVVLALPGGLDGRLVEGGNNLSGGQRQRLEIARALVVNPSILVLDEATSALDAETECTIVERLRLRGCTCVVVAHRLSTIRDCDEILVLDKGRIAERGTHEQLWDQGGLYAELLRAGEDVPDEVPA